MFITVTHHTSDVMLHYLVKYCQFLNL